MFGPSDAWDMLTTEQQKEIEMSEDIQAAKVTPGYTGHNSLGSEAIERLFGHHSAAIEDPDSLRVATAEVHAEVRTAFKKLARILDQLVPPGRGKSVMFTELETASMWAHKALAVRD